MATVERGRPPRRRRSPVENPATGEVIRTVPSLSRRRGPRAGRARPRRAARLGGARLRGPRARPAARPEVGASTTRDRLVETIVSETGKTHEDAQLAELAYAADAFGFWAKHAPDYLADEKVRSANPFVLGRKLVVRYAPRRRRRRDRPVELPADQLLRRLHPGAGGRQRGRAQAVRGHAAHLAADGRGDARVRPARRRLPGRDRRRARPARRWSTRSTWSCSPARPRPAGR